MRLGKIAVSVAIGALAVGAQAQTVRVPPVRTVADLGACDAFKLVGVTDGTSGATCSSGGGTTDVLCLCADGTWTPIPTSSSSGTVSSVALAVPAEWSVSGSPITTSGTITISEATQSANTVYAGPTTGGAAAPGFRSLVDADVPSTIATDSEVTSAISAHAAATDPHADRAYADTVGNLKLAKASNLSDLANAATARTNLGLAAIAASGSASDLSAGTVPTARLGSGTANSTSYLRGDQTWATVSAGIGGSLGAADNTVPRSDGTGGSTMQASALTVDDSGVVRAPTLGSELPTYSFTDTQSADNVRAGITALNGNLYTIVNSAGSALRTINITASATTGAVGEWLLGNVPATGTSPNIYPSYGDGDTGIGRAGSDQLSLIAGGVEAVRVTTTGATIKEVQFTPTDTPTACTDGTRGRVYFDDSLGEHCGCKGATGAATWQQLDGGGAC